MNEMTRLPDSFWPRWWSRHWLLRNDYLVIALAGIAFDLGFVIGAVLQGAR